MFLLGVVYCKVPLITSINDIDVIYIVHITKKLFANNMNCSLNFNTQHRHYLSVNIV